jgi:hypothetical protein
MSTLGYEIILYVSDQERSKLFYADKLQREPVLDVQGMIEFCILRLINNIKKLK